MNNTNNTENSIIRINNVCKSFKQKDGEVKALKDVNFSVNKGEIYGIIGFSGAGKSTLVRCINMLCVPDSGEVNVCGKDLTKASKGELRNQRRNIGMIFQQFNLLSQKKVIDNVMYPLEIAGINRNAARNKAEELLNMVGLGDKVNAYPNNLSGGQKQRVAIARALATNPEILLCDEATSALDPITTRSILELLRDINEKLGVTIVIITHQLSVVVDVCDRVAIMADGIIVEEGDVKEVFVSPKSETGKRLVLSDENDKDKLPTKDYIRIVFDGGSSYEPVLANIILKTQIPVNILAADMEDIKGQSYGQMYIEQPRDRDKLNTLIKVLEDEKLSFSLEEVTA